MDTQTAHLILNSIAAVAVVVWLAGLRFILVAARQPRVDDGLDSIEAADRLPIQGMAEVDGEPEDLALSAASILAKGLGGQISPVRIVSQTAEAVVFEGDSASTAPGRFVRCGAIHFARIDQGRTRIEYGLGVPQGKALLYVGAIFQALGLAAIAAGYWLLDAYVVDAPNPGVRAQAIQMVQVCHFLWPPFLLGALYRQRQRALRSIFDTFVCNLPYCQP